MRKILIKNAKIVNEGEIIESDLLISNGRIEKIAKDITPSNEEVIDAKGKYLLPGAIDDQVHFRDPGVTYKADIYTESRAAVAGGITSFMEMPNTVPNALTQDLLEDKYQLGATKALANYSFYMGASNENIEEVLKTDKEKVCGVKVFMGSSTGNMLVDSEKTLDNIFSNVDHLIATHCEDEATIRKNTVLFREKYGDDMPISYHPKIRNNEACFLSSSLAVRLAKKHGTRLNILHLSSAEEMDLFDNTIPLEQKKITAEVCIHHMWFTDEDYDEKGTLIKWNPAVKSQKDQDAIWKAIKDGRVDIIATDHAPHTAEEKDNIYWDAPSGGPLVQHAMPALFDFYHQGKITLEEIVQKICHNVAIAFKVRERGYIREGYWADLMLVDLDSPWEVTKSNILYKCKWSPFEGHKFKSSITHTFVNGNLVYENGAIIEGTNGQRLLFNN
jgi:dihydroorotase